jgi:nucleotide-binding universal stress UspA family protein
MGASGRHGFDRIALGSETERVVRASHVPVLVVP